MSAGNLLLLPPLLLEPGPVPGTSPLPRGVARLTEVFQIEDLDALGLPLRESGATQVLVPRVHDAACLRETLVRLPASHGCLLGPRVDPREVAGELLPRCVVELARPEHLERLGDLPVGGWAGRGQDAPGLAGELTSFVLFQLLDRARRRLPTPPPLWMTGVTGPELLQAFRAEGVSGLLLAPDLRQPQGRGPRLRVPLGEGLQLRLWGQLSAPEWAAEQARALREPAAFLRETLEAGRWHGDPEDLAGVEDGAWLGRWAELWRRTPVGPPVGNLFRAPRENRSASPPPADSPAHAASPAPGASPAHAASPPLAESPWQRLFPGAPPLSQGPLSRIAVSVPFARAVHAAGAFPHLALAGLSLSEVDELLAEASASGIPYGAGVVGVGQSEEDFEAVAQLLERYRPSRVLLAAPQLEQVPRLVATGLELFVHAPTPALLGPLHALGVRHFVLEGEEAGGHVSTTGSLALWQGALEWVRAHADTVLTPEDPVSLVFAGGIQGEESVGLPSSLVHFHGLARRLPVALQVGSAYLATDELRELGPLGAVYQHQVLEGRETLVTGESLGLRVRQVATESMRELSEREREIAAREVSQEEKRRAIEACYLGGLRKALEPGDPRPGASYMAGAAISLIEGTRSLAALHRSLLGPRPGVPGAMSGPGLAVASGGKPLVEGRAPAREPVAIIGVGAVLPGSLGAPEFFRNLMRGRCFVRDVPGNRWERPIFLSPDRDLPLHSYSGIAGLVGEVPFDSGAFRIPPNVARSMDRSQVFALLAAREALEDGGYLERPFDRSRVGVVLGNSMGGDAADRSAEAVHQRRMAARLMTLARERDLGESLEELLAEYQQRFPGLEVNEDTLPGELSNVIAGRVAWAFDLHGENYTVDAACASGLAAVAAAVEALRSGRLDMVLTGGVDTQTDVGTFVKFSKLTALSAEGSFPFDSRGDGFVVGEGGAVFLLKRYQDALRDGDPVYALILGHGSSSDGAGQGITAPRSGTQVLAMRRSLEDAGLGSADLDYVECHGTGTTLGDATETESLSLLREGAGEPLWMGSVKAQLGHLKAGAGAAGLLRATYVAHTRALPPQVNFETPRKELAACPERLRVSPRARSLGADPARVGVSSFGFGGTNFHLTLATPPAGARPPVVAPERFFHPDPGPLGSDLALLFPGQGSQYVGMLAELREEEAVVARWEEADAVFRDLRGEPLSPFLYPELGPKPDKHARERAEEALRDTAIAQPAIFTVSAILLDQLRDRGIEAGMMIGHSLGEYSALYAAGVLSFADALRAVSIRGLSMRDRSGGDAGSMAFLACGPEAAAEVCEAVPGYVIVANLNSYDQTVVSGESGPVAAVVQRAESLGITARALPVAAAFHSRLVSESVRDMAAMLREVDLGLPSVPVPANLTGRLYPRRAEDPEAYRSEVVDLLTRQIEEPVDFVSQVELAYQAGIRRFVEVGPKNVLARLVEDILQGKPNQSLHLDRRRKDVRPRLAKLAADLERPLAISRLPLPARAVVLPGGGAPSREATAGGSPEERIRQVVSEISGYAPERIGRDDDFEKDLGIDTLKIFEIFSRLRSTVLPPGVQNFRELTTLGKILGALEGGAADPVGSSPREAGFELLERREQEVAGGLPPGSSSVHWNLRVLPGAEALSGGLDLDAAPRPSEDSGGEAGEGELLLFPLPADPERLQGEVYPWLHEQLRDLGSGRVRLVSRETEGFSRAAYRSLGAFVRSVTKDKPELALGYLHLAGRPASGELAALLERPSLAARRDPEGRLLEDRLVAGEALLGETPALDSLLGPGDRVLVTGGARGIAATLVQDLLPRCEARFLLLGRRPEGPDWVEADDRERVDYLSWDLSRGSSGGDPERDPEDAGSESGNRPGAGALREALSGVTVLVHAAGVEISRNLGEKTPEEFQQVMAPKVRGLETLLRVLDREALRGVVLFSSVAGLFGNHGQADYAAANGYLEGRSLEGVPVTSLAWPPWAGVGMASRGAVQEILELGGVRFLSVEEGQQVFREALAETLARRTAAPRALALLGELGPGFLLPEETLLADRAVPLLAGGRLDLRYRFDLGASPYLRDHRVGSRYYLPAVSLVRQFLKRVEQSGHSGLLEFADVRFLAPVVFRDGDTRRFRVQANQDHYVVECGEDELVQVCELDLHLGGAPLEEQASTLRDQLGAAGGEPLPFGAGPLLGAGEEIYKTYFHGPRFQVLEGLEKAQGRVLEARLAWPGDPSGERAEEENPLLEYARIPWLLEGFFHAAGLATTIHIDCPWYYIPASLARCCVDPAACARARGARVRVEVLETGERKRFRGLVEDLGGRALLVVEDLVMARSPERVPHPKAILPSHLTLELGGLEVLQVDVEEAASWGREHPEVFTPREQAEIGSAPEGLRRDQRLAGRLAAKALAARVLRREVRKAYPLGDFEVLSGGGPVQVSFLGAPHLDTLLLGWHFNLSHSGSRAVAATSRTPCGVDLEEVRPLQPEARERALGAGGEARLGELLGAHRSEPLLQEFYRQALPLLGFTRREAVLKACGRGLGGGYDQVEPGSLEFSVPTTARLGEERYQVLSVHDERFVLTVARLEETGRRGA